MKKRSKSNWDKVSKLKDGEIDYYEIPPLNEDFFKKAVVWSGPKKQVTLRLDPDILDFFRSQGRGYQSRINAVLRRYVDAQTDTGRE